MSSNGHFLLVLSGPSGAGKSTFVRKALEHYEDVVYSISATTRQPRGAEKHGVDYFFVSEDEFDKMIENDALLEWAQVYNKHYYGTPKEFVTETLKTKNLIIDVDVQGGLQIIEKFPAAIFIFVQAKDIKTLEQRISKRGMMLKGELKARLQTAEEEMKYRDRYDHVIINDSLDKAFSELISIIESRKAQYHAKE